MLGTVIVIILQLEGVILRVPKNCRVSTVIHEIGHGIQLIHEHQRTDREKYMFMPLGTDGYFYNEFTILMVIL